MYTRLAIAFSLLLVAFFAMPRDARAQSDETFTILMDRAYGSFRSAYWYTKTDNLGVAAIEMMMFDETWKELRRDFEAMPPAIYAADPQWRETLAEIGAINSEALGLVTDGDRPGGLEKISRLQRSFAELRARNGITSFSDHVNDYDAVVNRLSQYRAWDKNLSDDDWRQMEKLAVDVEAAIASLEKHAPGNLASEPDFMRTIDANRSALGRFNAHLANRDAHGAKGSIRDLRSAYGLLFLKYG